MGLGDTQQICKVLVHPRNPNIVYVAAMGHFWSPNTERGIFRSRDGGKNWQRVLYISDQTGAIDVEMDPANPETLYASAWQLPSGLESGIYRSTDGGTTWKKLTRGLPAGPLGRNHIAIAPTDSRMVYFEQQNGAIQRMNLAAVNPSVPGPAVERLAPRAPAGQPAWRFAFYTPFIVSQLNPRVLYAGGSVIVKSNDRGATWCLSAPISASPPGASAIWCITARSPRARNRR